MTSPAKASEQRSDARPQGAGYSGTPLAGKLGIRAGSVVAVVAAPEGLEKMLGDLPDGVVLRGRLVAEPT